MNTKDTIETTFAINPKEHEKNRGLLIFFSLFGTMWFVGTILSTANLCSSPSLSNSVALLFCLIVFAFSVIVLISMNCMESITVLDDSIIIKSHIFPRFKRVIQKQDFKGLVLDYPNRMASLFVAYNSDNELKLIPVAAGVSRSEKQIIKHRLSLFFEENDCIDKTS